ncbi:piriformospora indica-insensitive protein 2 [Brachypodium distachyon]|uniref:Disease resistance R13L4/SHOC-2-like LRR domain-containing protein n=1 Tax=Brachypodium distachyon TaxID=15368 RepID=I1HHA3_BRADI|nr:piriformospora indica-insensitive protein 2 [Brachypodium distachyon]KQK05243.1 hypothetical protein BRADI_2g18952v3 [Brachypodium distachyon]|eukprot:XP_003566006.1 piriformospora indica-insensitive protein 2 [Brachypodium distachyon]
MPASGPVATLLMSLILSATVAVAGAMMDPAEREALLRVMEAVSSDRDWRSSSSSADPCSSPWPGLECKPADPTTKGPSSSSPAPATVLLHVTRLDFGVPPNPTCKATATFPSHAFLPSSLPHLRSIFFVSCFNNPSSPTRLTLPPAANLSSSSSLLQQLGIRSNPSLSGTLPPQLTSLSNLQVLTISQNSLIRGELPESIGKLKNLVHLDLSYNSLTGSIPSTISQLRNLAGLDLSYNSFSGPIPATLGNLLQLQKLDLCSNNLTGPLPSSIVALKSLTLLSLSNNGLSGGIPAGISGMRELQYLIMENNAMAGLPLPPELGKMARLQELRLASSGYSGPIPDTLGLLSGLTTLSLQDNNLTGRIPPGLTRLKRMYHLNLSKNGLDGEVPFDGKFLRRLGRNLDLSGNPGLCVGDRAVDVKDVGVSVCHGGGGGESSDAAGSLVWPGLLLRLAASVLLCCCCVVFLL